MFLPGLRCSQSAAKSGFKTGNAQCSLESDQLEQKSVPDWTPVGCCKSFMGRSLQRAANRVYLLFRSLQKNRIGEAETERDRDFKELAPAIHRG